MIPYRSIDLPNLRKAISESLQKNASLYGRVRIRAVGLRNSGFWQLVWCAVEAYPANDEAPADGPSYEYANAILVESWITPGEIEDFLNTAGGGTIRVGDYPLSVSIVGDGTVHLHEALPTDPWRSGRPTHHFTMQGSIKPTPGFEELLDPVHPLYFPDIYTAIGVWVNPPRYGAGRDQRFGSILVHLPDCRAHFEKLEHADGGLTVVVAATDTIVSSLRIRGMYVRPSGFTQIVEDAVGEPLRIPLPHDTRRLDLALLTTSGEELDWHNERPPLDPPPRGTVLNPTPGPSMADDQSMVERALQLGEGESVEFKPWVDPGDRKFDEVVDTAIAFANTHGGVILFGVDDHCAPNTTVNQALVDAVHKRGMTEDAAVVWALGAIRQRIGGALNRVPELRTASVTIDNRTVLLLEVPEGPEKPYARRVNNDVYVRKGANNVRPHPDHDFGALVRGQLGIGPSSVP